MGLILYPDEIIAQSNSMNTALTAENERLQRIAGAVQEFVEEQNLISVSWFSLKRKLSDHISIIRRMICANDKLNGLVGNTKLIQEEIENDIHRLKIAINTYESNIEYYRNKLLWNTKTIVDLGFDIYYTMKINEYSNLIDNANVVISRMERRIETLFQIEDSTKGLYDVANSLYLSVKQGIQMVQCDYTKMGFIAASNNSWKGKIDSAWKTRGVKKAGEYVKEGLGDGYLTYDELVELSKEERYDYLEKVSKIIFNNMPDIKMGIGDTIEIPLGSDTVLYYGIEGEVGTDDSNMEIGATIEEHRAILESVSIKKGNAETGFDTTKGSAYYKIETEVNGQTTLSFQTEVDPVDRSIKVENSVKTSLESASIESTIGIRKNINNQSSDIQQVEAIEEVYVPKIEQKPSLSENIENAIQNVPKTGDGDDIFHEIIGNIYDWFD